MTQNANTISRRQALKGLGGVSAFALLPGCAGQLHSDISPGLPQTVAPLGPDQLLDQVAWNLLEHSPAGATGLGVDTGDKAYLRGQFGGTSQSELAELAATLAKDLALVKAYPRAGMTPEQLTSFDVVESCYRKSLEGFALPYGDVAVGSWRNAPYVVIQNVGAYLDLPRFMSSTQPLRDAADVGYYLSRLEQIPAVLGGELERIKAARAMGVVPPDFLLDKAIGQLKTTLLDAMGGGSLVEPLESSDLAAAKSAAAQAKSIVQQSVAPALEAQLAELFKERELAKSNAGMWAQPRGDEWYTWALSASTTTSMTPDEVHERGLEELAELHGRMDPILKEIGYTKGSVGERMQALGKDERYKWPDNDAGREAIMEFIQDRVDWIKAQMPRAFNTLVDPNMEVKRIPVAEELGAPGAYGGAGSKDGTIPGRMWINLRTTELHRKYDLADLVYHETIPGHVWEGEFSNSLPLIRSMLAFNAFSEGWALYGEQMADELGAYDEFKVGRLGYLQSLAFRACRMVVDTGLHHKRWTREQGRNFFIERNGSKPEEVASEVDRYCSWPGQACGYKVGHSTIVGERKRAQAALGSTYDFKAFNDAVIQGGNVPMDVLAKNVDRYIARAG